MGPWHRLLLTRPGTESRWHWSRRVDALDLGDGLSVATVGIGKGFALSVSWRPGSDHLTVSLWARDRVQGGTVGLEDGVPSWLAAIPLCTCGEQGCSNASFGFQVTIDGEDLPALVDTLQALPHRHATLALLKTAPRWEGPRPEA